MGMILDRRRGAAAAVVVALFTAVLVWAAPAAQAATCQAVPGSTIGTDVSIAGQKFRVPAISGIQVCVGSVSVPLVTVETSGGACTFSCLSVLVGGGPADAEGITITYLEDGVPKSVPVTPPPVDGPPSTCVLSVGSPDAPYPDCFISIGPELGDPIGDVTPVVGDAVDAVLDVYAFAVVTALDTAGAVAEEAGDAVAAACAELPATEDQSGNDVHACDDPAAWVEGMRYDTYEFTCESIPPMRDHNWYTRYEFCEYPHFWLQEAIYYATCQCSDIERQMVSHFCWRLRSMDVEPGTIICGLGS
jgi:hypothetical protein